MYLRFLVLLAALALIAADGAVATSSSKEEQVLKAATTRRFRDDRLYDDSLHRGTTDTTEERLSLNSIPNFLSRFFSRFFSRFSNLFPSSSSEKVAAKLARHNVDEEKAMGGVIGHAVDEKEVAATLRRKADIEEVGDALRKGDEGRPKEPMRVTWKEGVVDNEIKKVTGATELDEVLGPSKPAKERTTLRSLFQEEDNI